MTVLRLKSPRISEHDSQAQFISAVKYTYRNHADFIERLLFSVPNGAWLAGGNRFALMAKYKAEGLTAGVSDLLYLQPRGDYAYLAIEMKATDKRNVKGAVSPDQAEFLACVNGAGGLGDVCYGCDEALGIFEYYMSLK